MTEYNHDANKVTLDNNTLAMLAQKWETPFNSLSGVEIIAENAGDSSMLGPESEKLLMQALKDQATCKQMIYFRYAVADEEASRHTYVCAGQNGELAVWAKGLHNSIVTYSSKAEVKEVLLRTLATGQQLSRPNVDIFVSVQAVLVFLAVLDTFRYFRLQSILAHTKPPESITDRDVFARLCDPADDFRWLLPFAQGALPGMTGPLVTMDEVTAALKELAKAGLISYIEADNLEEGPVIYSLTDLGRLICDGILHDVSKVAVRVSEISDDGETGHAVQLFVRDSRFLWAFALNGSQGYISGVGPQGLERLIDAALAFSSPHTPVSNRDDSAQKCPSCGSMIAPNDRFCQNCGAKAAAAEKQFCANCGAKYEAEAQFCIKCGKARF